MMRAISILKRHDHIWVLEVPAASDEPTKPLQLTSGDYDEGEIVWTHDGSRIYFLTERDRRALLRTSEHGYLLHLIGRRNPPEKLATVPMGIGDLVLSPDGRSFAFHGSVTQPVRSYSQPDLWVMDVAPKAPQPQT